LGSWCWFRVVIALAPSWALAISMTGPVLVTPSPAFAQEHPGLELELARAIEVPAGFVVQGGALVDDSTIVAWGSTGLLRVRGGAHPQVTPLPEHVTIRGARIVGRDPMNLELVDGLSGRMAVADIEGRLRWSGTPLTTGRITQTIPLAGGWLVLGESRDGRPGGLHLWMPGSKADRIAWSEAERDVGVPGSYGDPAVRLSSGSEGGFVSELEAPFRAWRVVPSIAGAELTLLPGSLGVAEAAASRGFPLDRTVSLPILELDQGRLLVQLSDLTSDRRLMLILDERGEIVRATVLDVARCRVLPCLRPRDGLGMSYPWLAQGSSWRSLEGRDTEGWTRAQELPPQRESADVQVYQAGCPVVTLYAGGHDTEGEAGRVARGGDERAVPDRGGADRQDMAMAQLPQRKE
jgi:hypothetical protein